jgi:hypothetical protein
MLTIGSDLRRIVRIIKLARACRTSIPPNESIDKYNAEIILEKYFLDIFS